MYGIPFWKYVHPCLSSIFTQLVKNRDTLFYTIGSLVDGSIKENAKEDTKGAIHENSILGEFLIIENLKGDAKKSRHGLYKIASKIFNVREICLNQQKTDTNSFSKWGSFFLYLKHHRSYATFSSKLHFTKS